MNRNRILFAMLLFTASGIWLLQAGSLEPPGPPSSTMVSLDSIPSSWHQNLSILRFEVVLNNEAVLDHETGLVWQRLVAQDIVPWADAVDQCHAAPIGDRFGWRLPSVEELSTLVDLNQADPALPPLHPFIAEGAGGEGGTFATYWTSTTVANDTANAWTVSFAGNGFLGTDQHKQPDLMNLDFHAVWCVRGSVGLDTARP